MCSFIQYSGSWKFVEMNLGQACTQMELSTKLESLFLIMIARRMLLLNIHSVF
jgi:hypothetical protein